MLTFYRHRRRVEAKISEKVAKVLSRPGQVQVSDHTIYQLKAIPVALI